MNGTNGNIKKKYIDCVYELLETEGIEGISIRRVAKELNCNSASLYRYFDNVEYLICLASIKYLEPYLKDVKEYSSKIKNPLELNAKLWENYCRYSFKKPEIFEMLFFGQYKDSLMDIMYEYYDIYKDAFLELDAFSISFLFTADIFERNYVFYRRGANQGILSQELAKKLANMEVYMFHGMLCECKEKHYEGKDLENKVQEFVTYSKTLHLIYAEK